MFRSLIAIALATSATYMPALAQQVLEPSQPIIVPMVNPADLKPLQDAYPTPNLPDRITYIAPKTKRGTSVDIPEEVVIRFCSGKDGCTARLVMHNWDDTGRIASREFLFFYNKDTGVWRSSADSDGANSNNITQHVYQAWSCYFTDGQYENWQDKGDTQKTFGLLSWNQYNADCYLTIVR
jgi:hypothetical protein